MTRMQLFSAVGDMGEDLISRATDDRYAGTPDAARAHGSRPSSKRTRRRVAVAVAACLLVAFVGAIYVQVDLNYFAASCGASLGTIEDGVYYYRDINAGFYAYDPATGRTQRLVGELFHNLDGIRVNGYGSYYTASGRLHLKMRLHETGETVTLYTASADEYTHTGVTEIYEDTLLFSLYNKHEYYRTILLLDARTGEVLETLCDREPYRQVQFTTPYPVGERHIGYAYVEGYGSYVTEDGEPLLIDGQQVVIGTRYGTHTYAGDSLVVNYTLDNPYGHQYILLRPNGENVKVQNRFEVIAGTNEYLFGFPNESQDAQDTLCAYRIDTGETVVLIENYRMQEVATDGTYLFATAPWSHHTDVYRLVYTADGTLTGVTLVDIIGD